MGKQKAKKARTLIVTIYPSGVVGKGKSTTVRKRSVLTPKQYTERYYRSTAHERTEYAINAKLAPKTKKTKRVLRSLKRTDTVQKK